MELYSFDNFSSRDGHDSLKQCWQHDHGPDGRKSWDGFSGYCPSCAARKPFSLAGGTNPAFPNTRENLLCSGCGLNSRTRAAFMLLSANSKLAEGSVTYLTEQATNQVWRAAQRFPGSHLW